MGSESGIKRPLAPPRRHHKVSKLLQRRFVSTNQPQKPTKMPCKGCGNNCQCQAGKCGGNCAGNSQCQCAAKTGGAKCCQAK